MTAQAELSHTLSALEEQMVPLSYTRDIPQEFTALPALQRRAEVEMVIRKPDYSPYDVDGKLYEKVTLRMVVDGYNAPITGGNFVDLVNRGFYNNKKVKVPPFYPSFVLIYFLITSWFHRSRARMALSFRRGTPTRPVRCTGTSRRVRVRSAQYRWRSRCR
jgi:hypothetical protein